MPYMWGDGFGWWNMLWMLVPLLLIAVLIGLAIWALARGRSPLIEPREPAVHEPSALDILRQRYARGEIDTPTFEEMRARLEGHGHEVEPRLPTAP
jgi:putative membrane protein